MVFFLLAKFTNGEKRIVLHSSTDLGQEFLKLKSEFEAFKVNVSSKISTLETENVALKNQLTLKKGTGFPFLFDHRQNI